MELRQLQYFLKVTESGSVSKAASVIGVTQSALSRQVRQLEEELGVQLFYRHGRGIRMTRKVLSFTPRSSRCFKSCRRLRPTCATPQRFLPAKFLSGCRHP